MVDSSDNARIYPICSEPLGVFSLPLDSHKSFKKLLESIRNTASSDLRRKDVSTSLKLEHICNLRNQNIFKQFPELSELKDTLSSLSLNFISSIGYVCDEVVFTDAWLNIGSKDAVLPPHVHANSFISGTYYINFNKESHTPLDFYNDRLNIDGHNTPFMTLPIDKSPTPYNQRKLVLSCSEGDVAFWRSNLLHGYMKPNPTDNRLTLSFNLMPKICSDGRIYSFTVMN